MCERKSKRESVCLCVFVCVFVFFKQLIVLSAMEEI